MGGWADTKPSTNSDKKYLEDLVEVFKFPDGKWVQTRAIGPVTSYYQLWFTLEIEDKNTKKRKIVTIPRLCLDYNPKTESFDDNGCPYRKAYESGKYNYKVRVGKQEQPVIRVEKRYLGNFIIRSIQDNMPRKLQPLTRKEKLLRSVFDYEAHYKEPGSKSWTPSKTIKVAPTLAVRFQSLKDMNKRKVTIKGKKKEKNFDISHPVYGVDVNLKYDSKAKGTAMYDAQFVKRTKLTEDELALLLQDNDVLKPMSKQDALRDWKDLVTKIVKNPDNDAEDVNEDDDEDMEDEAPKKKSSKVKKKKSKDLPWEDKKKPAKTKKKVEEDDDDLDDLESLDDLEDEPKKKKDTSKKKATKRTKRRR